MLLSTSVAFVSGPASAHSWTVDDPCNKNNDAPYFYLGGPLSSWNIHSGQGVGNCHAWTTTIDESLDVVNYAAWYLAVSASYDHTNYNYYVWFSGGTCDSHFNARDARYRRYRDGSGQPWVEVYRINQNVSVCSQAKDVTGSDVDAWYGSLGGQTRLIDKSTDTPGTRIGADQAQWVQ
jgi:hypothetical protein